MESLTEGERVGSWILLLILVFLGSIAYYVASLPERMAKQGYTPYRLPGDTTIYWYVPSNPASMGKF